MHWDVDGQSSHSTFMSKVSDDWLMSLSDKQVESRSQMIQGLTRNQIVVWQVGRDLSDTTATLLGVYVTP